MERGGGGGGRVLGSQPVPLRPKPPPSVASWLWCSGLPPSLPPSLTNRSIAFGNLCSLRTWVLAHNVKALPLSLWLGCLPRGWAGNLSLPMPRVRGELCAPQPEGRRQERAAPSLASPLGRIGPPGQPLASLPESQQQQPLRPP